MITYSMGVLKCNVEQFKFPGGEVGVRIPTSDLIGRTKHDEVDITVTAYLKNSDDVMALLLTVDALRRQHPFSTLYARIPYVPYARQDRRMVSGDSLSIAVMAQLINSCNFRQVTILDPHSDVTPALINNVKVVDQVAIFRKLRHSWDGVYIVAPDAGATKKAYHFATAVNAAGVITCSKHRDMATGQILGFKCDADLEQLQDATLVVIDDICDGGRTFIELAGVFGGGVVKRLDLAVTHGIFSKGFEVVAQCYDNVYTTNSYHGEILDTPYNVTWVEVF